MKQLAWIYSFISKLLSAQEEETETEDSDDSMIKLIVKQTTKITSMMLPMGLYRVLYHAVW